MASAGRYGVSFSTTATMTHADYLYSNVDFAQFRQFFSKITGAASNQDSDLAALTGTEYISVPVGIAYFIGTDRNWFVDQSVAPERLEVRAKVNETDYATTGLFFGIQSSVGYRWLFRHGSYISVAIGCEYRKALVIRGNLNQAFIDSPPRTKATIDKLFVKEQFSPVSEIFLGYLFN